MAGILSARENPNLFLRAVLATPALLLASTVLLNAIVDPAHLFDESRSYEHGIARLLASRSNVAGVDNYDDRLMQKYRTQIEKRDPVDWVVIGSSRSMLVNQTMLGPSLINLSVSAAGIEDDIALLELSAAYAPRNILLTVDPWLFNGNTGNQQWKSLATDYAVGLASVARRTGHGIAELDNRNDLSPSTNLGRYLQLINFEYTGSSLRELRRRIQGEGRPAYFPKASDLPEKQTDLIRADGSRVYNQQFADINPAELQSRAEAHARPPVYLLERFDFMDQRYIRLFEAMLDYATHKSNVVIFLPPYHPRTFGLIAPRFPQIRQVEQYVRTVAAVRHITVVGSYDPTQSHCDDQEFLDGIHSRETCIRKILIPLKSIR